MIKLNGKKLTALLLCLIMLLSACASGASTSGNDIQNSLQSGKQGANNGTNSGEDDYTGPRGKFVELDITPENLKGEIDSLQRLEDGRMLLITFESHDEGAPIQAFVAENAQEWTELDLTALNNYRKENASLRRSYYAMDSSGSWWIANYSLEGEMKLHCFNAAGEGRVINVPKFEEPQTGEEAAKRIDAMFIDGDTLLLDYCNNTQRSFVIVDTKTGEVQNTYPITGYPRTIGFENGKAYLVPAGENKVEVISAADGQLIDTFNSQIQDGILGYVWSVSIDKADTLCYALPTGIEKAVLGGSTVQIVVDNPVYAYASPSFGAYSCIADDEGGVWIACGERGEERIYYYFYDENAPQNAEKNLYIWTLENNVLLRDAIYMFCRNNPNYDVTLEIGRTEENSGLTDEDIIRELNLRLVAGESPDVLILDGLPVSGMIRQDMLLDLAGTVDKTQYYENVLNAFSYDGKDYAYPAAFQIPLVANAHGKDVSGLATFEAFAQMAQSPQNIYFGGYSYLFDALYDAYSAKMFPNGSQVDEEALKEFLLYSQKIAEGQGLIGIEFDMSADGYSQMVGDKTGLIQQIVKPPTLKKYGSGKWGRNVEYTAFTMQNFSLNFEFDFYGEIPGLAPLPGNAFVPACVAGVPVNAANTEGGAEFIASMLEKQDKATAQIYMLPGFLVKRGVEYAESKERYDIIKARDTKGEYVTRDPSLTDWEALKDKLELPAITDIELKNKVYEEARMLYSGYSSVEDTHAAIIKNTKLYFAEKQ